MLSDDDEVQVDRGGGEIGRTVAVLDAAVRYGVIRLDHIHSRGLDVLDSASEAGGRDVDLFAVDVSELAVNDDTEELRDDNAAAAVEFVVYNDETTVVLFGCKLDDGLGDSELEDDAVVVVARRGEFGVIMNCSVCCDRAGGVAASM